MAAVRRQGVATFRWRQGGSGASWRKVGHLDAPRFLYWGIESLEDLPSGTSNKPWGGKLEAVRDYPDPAMTRFDTVSWVGLLLRKGAELSLLAVLLAVPMMYQWDLPVKAQAWFQQLLERGRFFDYQLNPWIGGMMPVLESKFGAWAVLGMLMICFFLGARIFELFSKRRFFPLGASVGDESRRTPHRLVPLVCIAAFLGLGLLSIIFWPPGVPPEARQFLGGEGGGYFANLGGGGFLFSTIAWVQLAFALFFFLVAEDLIRRRPFVVKILSIIVIAGIVNAIWVLLLKMGIPLLESVWVQFGDRDYRNNFGAFIGHNTGMSSFMMAPILVSLMWVFSISPKRNRPIRLLVAIGILLMTLAVVIAQSRAVIPILCVVVPLMLFMLARRSCLLYGTRLYIWLPVAVFFIVMTQVIESQYNPFFRRDITLEQRVGQLTASHLSTETRLRILWVSATELIPQRVVAGHGFGTFQYVYPSAQGEFYRKNPVSALAPTSLRTMRAHNEYLQVLVELGLLGLLVGLTALYFLFRGAWGVLQRTLMPHHISTQISVLCAIIAILIHSALDFPLRVPPIAVTLLVLLAVLSAGDRLWIFPLKPPTPAGDDASDPVEDPPTEDAEIGLPPVSAEGSARGMSTSRAWATGSLALAIFFVGGMALAILWSPFQSISTLVNRGQAMLEGARVGGPHAYDYLQAAQEDLRVGRRHFWIHGPSNRIHSQAQLIRARFTMEEANRQHDIQLASQIRALGVSFANHGINDINQGLSEENFHVLYRHRAALNNLISRNDPDPTIRRRHRQNEMEDLFRAAGMNPGDPDTLYLLIQILEEDVARNRGFLVDYIRTLHHFHPRYFHDTLYTQVLDATAMGEWDLAMLRLEILIEAVPDDYGLKHIWTTPAIQVGRIEEARRVLGEVTASLDAEMARPNLPPREVQRLRTLREYIQLSSILADIKAGNDLSALREISREDDFLNTPPSHLAAVRLYLKSRINPSDESISAVRQEIERLGRVDPIAFQVAATAALYMFDLPGEAERWMRRRFQVADPPVDIAGHVILARALARQERYGEAIDVFGPWNGVYQRFPEIDTMIGTSYLRHLAQTFARELREKAVERTDSTANQDQ